MKKKNIIFLSNATGGIRTFQNNLIKFFLTKRVQLILIDSENVILNKLKKKKLFKFYKCDVLYKYLKCIKIFFEITKKNRLNENIFIISNPTIFAIYFIFIKLIFKNSKIVFFFHSHLLNINLLQILSGLLTSIFSIFIYKSTYVSNFTKVWWNKYFPLTRFSRNYVIHNKIILPTKAYKKNYKKLKIGFVGRLEKEKGIDKYLEITKNINSKKFEYYVFGDGSFKIDKKRFKKIKYYNWSKQNKIYRKINTLFVTSKIENCPMNVLEAKSYGIPTISISNGGIQEIIKNNNDGILLNYNASTEKIKRKLYFLLHKYKYFEKNCKRNTDKFIVQRYKIKYFI